LRTPRVSIRVRLSVGMPDMRQWSDKADLTGLNPRRKSVGVRLSSGALDSEMYAESLSQRFVNPYR